MVHQLHIVVADLLEGGVKGLYVGTDFAEANAAFEKAGAEFEAVRLFDFPTPTRLRYPAQEDIDIKVRSEAGDQATALALAAKKAELQKHTGLAEEHSKKADAIALELYGPAVVEEEEPETESSAAPKAKKGPKAKK